MFVVSGTPTFSKRNKEDLASQYSQHTHAHMPGSSTRGNSLVEYSEEDSTTSDGEQRPQYGPSRAPPRSRWDNISSSSSDSDCVVEDPDAGKGAAGEADPSPPMPALVQKGLMAWLKPTESSTKQRERATAKS